MSAYLEQAVLGAGQEQAFFIAGEMALAVQAAHTARVHHQYAVVEAVFPAFHQTGQYDGIMGGGPTAQRAGRRAVYGLGAGPQYFGRGQIGHRAQLGQQIEVGGSPGSGVIQQGGQVMGRAGSVGLDTGDAQGRRRGGHGDEGRRM